MKNAQREINNISADEVAFADLIIGLYNEGKITAHDFCYLAGEQYKTTINRVNEIIKA